MSQEFVKFMKEARDLVYGVVIQELEERFHEEFKEFNDIVRDYPLRKGKYFRPALVLLSYAIHSREFKGTYPEHVLRIAAAMQFSEEWLLIHDDIMDGSLYRRGKPTLHRLYGLEHAINAGDYLHVVMWSVLINAINGMSSRKANVLMNKMADVLLRTAEGQFLDVEWIKRKVFDLNEEDYFAMVDRKAGYYTVTAPLQLGAFAADQNFAYIESLKEIGIPFGRAFQIWDDVMNLEVKKELQGKEQYGDVWEGKRTLMLIHVLRHASPKDTEFIRHIYSLPRSQKMQSEVDDIVNLMRKYGSIDYAKKVAIDQINKAKHNAKKILPHWNEKAESLLFDAMDFVVNRKW